MKKIVFLLLGLIITVALNAQFSNKDTGYDKVIKSGKTAFFYTGSASDTTGVGQNTLNKTFFINTNDEVTCDVYFDIDSLGGGGGAAPIYLRYKEFPDDTYSNMDTASYTVSADTTGTLNFTAAQKARYIRVSAVAGDDSVKVELEKVYLKCWK